MDKILWIGLVTLAGALLPIQAGLNGRMGRALESPEWAVLISFAVGSLAMLAYTLLTKNHLQLTRLPEVPAQTWIAGVLGAFYVAVVVLAFPRLGAALTFGLIVAGQLMISVLLDHFNILVQSQHTINPFRIIGIILIIAGVVIIRRF